MNLNLANKVAYIGGSSRGIGKSIAEAFLREGGRVVLTGRNPESLKTTGSEFSETYGPHSVISFCGDLEDPEFAAATLEETFVAWSQLDCLVANVGSGTKAAGWDLSLDDWHAAFSSNFWSSQTLVQKAIPWMIRTGGGSIVFIASIAGAEDIGAPVPYAVAKSAIISLGKCLCRLLAPENIRVNVVAPGNVLFPGGLWESKLKNNYNHYMEYINREIPLKRFGKPEEIADVVVFLSSGCAAFVTGAYILVDGGQSKSF